MEKTALRMCNRLFEQRNTHMDVTNHFKKLVKSMQNHDNLSQVHDELLVFQKSVDIWLGEVLHILRDISDMETEIETQLLSEMNGQDIIPARFYLKLSRPALHGLKVEQRKIVRSLSATASACGFNPQAERRSVQEIRMRSRKHPDVPRTT
jgi:hypothetical protein